MSAIWPGRGASRPAPGGRARRAAFLIPAAVACLVGLAVQLSGVLANMERATVSARFGVRGAERPTDVAVVGVDAKTFADLGRQWPFPRSLHGEVLRRLHAAGARSVVYDVQFTEPTTEKEDGALYDALGTTGGATLATSESDRNGRTRVLGGDDNLRAVHSRAGASDLLDDGESVARLPLEVSNLPALAVIAARRAGGPELAPRLFGDRGALIDYRGPPGTVPALSFSDVLRGSFPRDAVRGKVVVVGATAPTLRDVHPTPVGGGPMSGAEVQANAIWTALHGVPLRPGPTWLALALVVLLALAAPLAGSRSPGRLALAAGLAVAAALVAGAQLAFDAGLVVPVVAPAVALLTGAIGFVMAARLQDRRARLDTERQNEALEAKVRERTDQLWQTQLELVRRLGQAVDWRDGDTGEHVERIGVVCERLALAVGMNPGDAALLRHAALLHDVGKVGIPDQVLNKPGRLDPDEWALMQTHAEIGGDILANSGSELIQLACTVALTHHENWDGTGYPAKLSGREIPLAGRICAVADVFDALASPRPYKDAWPYEEIAAEITRLRGTKFDPELVDAFLPMAAGLYAEMFGGRAPARA